MIIVTGDTHKDFSRFSPDVFNVDKTLTKSDFIIIAGDFGGIWSTDEKCKSEIYWLDWLNDQPWTTLFIDGNHENFERLNSFKSQQKFGGEVGVIRSSIFHLKRGNVYVIDNKKIFTFGGADSCDKHMRVLNVSWWKEELPNCKEYELGLSKLDEYDNTVDIIITHTCPKYYFDKLSKVYSMDHKNNGEVSLRNYLDLIHKTVSYNNWFCGHFHKCIKFDKFQFLYEEIVRVI